MSGMTSIAYRDGVLTVNPEWYTTRDEFNSYSWAPKADKMIRIVKQSPKVSDVIDEELDNTERKLKLEIPRDVRQDIMKWCIRAAERRLLVKSYPAPKGKQFVIVPTTASERSMNAARGLSEAQDLLEVTGGYRGAVMALVDATLDSDDPDMFRVRKVLGQAADKLRGV